MRDASAGALVTLVVIVALAAAGCAKTNPTGWTPEAIAALPEAQLLPPGARMSKPSLEDGKDRVTVDTPTNVSFAIGFDQPYEEVVAFYDQRLLALGWTKSFATRSTRESFATAWTKGGLSLRLGVRAHRDSKPTGTLAGFANSANIEIAAYGKKGEVAMRYLLGVGVAWSLRRGPLTSCAAQRWVS